MKSTNVFLKGKTMKYFWSLIFLAAFLNCQSPLKIVLNHQTAYTIVIPQKSTPVEQFAAKELQQTIWQMTGVELVIENFDQNLSGPAFYLGNILELSSISKLWHPAEFEEDEYFLKTEGENIHIVSNNPRGLLYGVYALLNEKWGCRWYTRQVAKIPTRKNLSLPRLNETGKPAFESREVYFTEASDPHWCIRNRLNRSMKGIPDSLGGEYGIYPFVHTFYRLVPPEKYYKKHPEYFSLINGKRQGHEAQLCLTNPKVLEITTQQVYKWIEEHPGTRIITVDQNDGGGWCQCEKCMAINNAEGSQSGTILNFVNAIAKSVAKKYPNISIQTLAYYYSEKPPKTIRPHKNVIIRLCRYAEYCDAHPIEGCEVNKPFIDQLNSWNKIAPRIMVWDYLVDFRHFFMPFPNLDGIKKDIRFYYNHGVTGLFEQGSYPIQGAELSELRAWVLAQLLWDPFQDADDLIDEFLDNVYGAAAPYLQNYLELVHTKVRKDSIHFNMYAEPTVGHLTPDVIHEAEKIFLLAEKSVADSSELLKRVEAAHLPVLYTRLYFYTIGGKATYLTDEDMPKIRDKFLRIAGENGVKQLAENRKHGLFQGFIDKVNQSKGVFLTNWWLIGPFDNPDEKGLETCYPPEQSFDTTNTYEGLNNKPIQWQYVQEKIAGYIDFTHIFDPSEIGVAYARTTFSSTADAEIKIGIGSNDGVRLWVNDKLVLDKATKRTAKPNQEILSIPVKKGRNSVLLKIDQFGGGWGFYFSILEGDKFLEFQKQ